MSVHYPQLFANPTIISRIALAVSSRTRKTMCRVSKTWWMAARPIVWSNATAAGLVGLMVGSHPRRAPQPDRSGILGYLPQHFNPDAFERFLIYANYVHTLVLGGQGVLPEYLLEYLITQVEASGPLLPKLHTLLIVSRDHIGRWERLWSFGPVNWTIRRQLVLCTDIDSWIPLLLCPSLRILTVYCHFLAINPEVIAARAPNLQDLRLGYHSVLAPLVASSAPHRAETTYNPSTDVLGRYADVERTLGAWPTACLAMASKWSKVTHLTVNGQFLRHIHFQDLSGFVSLSHLRIIGPYNGFELEQVVSGGSSFPHLQSLLLEDTTHREAALIFGCYQLVHGLAHVGWISPNDLLSTPQEEVLPDLAAAVIALSQAAPPIKQLRCVFNGEISMQMSEALASFKLETLEVQGSDHIRNQPLNIAFVLSAGPELAHLVARSVVQVHQLAVLADAYPNLSSLTIDVLHGQSNSNDFDLGRATRHEQHIHLQLNLRQGDMPDMDDYRGWMISLARYLWAIWPNQVLTMTTDEDRPRPTPDEVEFVREFSEVHAAVYASEL